MRTGRGASEIAVGEEVELLYPFPQSDILELTDTYPNLREIIWVQEEPRNMGARAHMFPRLQQILPEHLSLGYVGRPERAASGEGYPLAHTREQNRIVSTALDLGQTGHAVPVASARGPLDAGWTRLRRGRVTAETS